MSDVMALLISQQYERELQVALERRRLQHEAADAKVRVRRTPGRWHLLWARASRPVQSPGGRVQAG